jgi:hypothetical protein
VRGITGVTSVKDDTRIKRAEVVEVPVVRPRGGATEDRHCDDDGEDIDSEPRNGLMGTLPRMMMTGLYARRR